MFLTCSLLLPAVIIRLCGTPRKICLFFRRMSILTFLKSAAIKSLWFWTMFMRKAEWPEQFILTIISARFQVEKFTFWIRTHGNALKLLKFLNLNSKWIHKIKSNAADLLLFRFCRFSIFLLFILHFVLTHAVCIEQMLYRLHIIFLMSIYFLFIIK